MDITKSGWIKKGMRYEPIAKGEEEKQVADSPMYEFRGLFMLNKNEVDRQHCERFSPEDAVKPDLIEGKCYIEISRFISAVIVETFYKGGKLYGTNLYLLSIQTEGNKNYLFYKTVEEAEAEIEGFYKFRTHIKASRVV